jgi:predicted nucleotidyltransferase
MRRMQDNATYRIDPQAFVGIPAVTPIGSERPVSETLPLAVEHIVQTLHPQKIILFGSFAYGTPTPDSDVDLLVVMDTPETRQAKRTWPVSFLLLPRPFAVDILVKTPAELAAAIEKEDVFIKEIVTQGKVLYERSERSVSVGV